MAALNAAVDDLQAAVAVTPATTEVITDAIDGPTTSLLGTVGSVSGVTVPLPSTTQTVAEAVATVHALVDQIQTLLNDLLAKGLAALDHLALLRLEGVEVGVATKAVETVAGSSATVTGRIGKVFVGGVALPGIDLAATATQISEAVAKVNTQLGTVLGTISPDLANVVKVSVLDQATSVTQDGGYTRSRAGVAAATATITPPATLAATVKTVTDAVGVADTLTAAGVAVPALDGLMNQLGGALSLTTTVLAAPAKVQVASVLSASDYRLAAAPTTPGAPAEGVPSLPRTGGPDLVLFGGLLAVLALAFRRLSRTAERQPIRLQD